MLSYQEADALLSTARDPYAGKPIGNNTRLHAAGGDAARGIHVRLHSTDVVTIYPNGSRALRTGGWQTTTTADRIRDYGCPTLHSVRGIWHLYLKPAAGEGARPQYPAYPYAEEAWKAWRDADREWQASHRVPFFEGVKVDANGFALRSQLPMFRRLTREYAAIAKREREARNARKRAERAMMREAQEAFATFEADAAFASGDFLPFYKRVGVDGKSQHGASYIVGRATIAPDYRADHACGSGLHFCSREHLDTWRSWGPRILLCAVEAATLVDMGDKVKARACYVLADVTADVLATR